jgi:glycosyltransferase involved in cell wall biosynthesis
MKSEIKQKVEKRQQLEHIVDITFYIPCCNEELNIIPTLDKLVHTIKKMHISFELLIYDDGSTDKTNAVIKKYAKEHPELLITLIHNKKRMGLGYNYVDGAFKGVGKYYMMVCGDNSETEESLTDVLSYMGKADIIIPYFGHLDTRSFFRRNLSRVFTAIVNSINGYQIGYYNGIVLHQRHNVMRWHPASSGFAYQAELLSILLDQHKTYIQVNISNKDRKIGSSKAFHAQNYFSVAHSLLQIFFRRIRRTVWPV